VSNGVAYFKKLVCRRGTCDFGKVEKYVKSRRTKGITCQHSKVIDDLGKRYITYASGADCVPIIVNFVSNGHSRYDPRIPDLMCGKKGTWSSSFAGSLGLSFDIRRKRPGRQVTMHIIQSQRTYSPTVSDLLLSIARSPAGRIKPSFWPPLRGKSIQNHGRFLLPARQEDRHPDQH
jgi:hypothetical protein